METFSVLAETLAALVVIGGAVIAIVKWERGPLRWVKARTIDRFKKWVETPRRDVELEATVGRQGERLASLEQEVASHQKLFLSPDLVHETTTGGFMSSTPKSMADVMKRIDAVESMLKALREQAEADQQEITMLRQAVAEAEPSAAARMNQLARNYAKGPVVRPGETIPSDAPRGR